MPEIYFVSSLNSPWEAVWEHVLHLDTLNQEMMPYFKMTGPPDNLLSLAERRPFGEPIFDSTVLLAGVLPAEQMRVTLAGGGVSEREGWFVEQSGMALMRQWRHERRVTRLVTGCQLSDRLSFELRLVPLTPALTPVLKRFFTHRHRWLQRRFGRLVDPQALP